MKNLILLRLLLEEKAIPYFDHPFVLLGVFSSSVTHFEKRGIKNTMLGINMVRLKHKVYIMAQ